MSEQLETSQSSIVQLKKKKSFMHRHNIVKKRRVKKICEIIVDVVYKSDE